MIPDDNDATTHLESWTKTIRRFRILHKLGEGGMGKVYKVQSLRDDKIYALKRIHCRDEDELNSALMEIIVTKSMGHDNLVNYDQIYLETASGAIILCISMDLFSTDLHQLFIERVRRQSPFTERELLYVLYQITSGLTVMHQRNLLHRDMKPANIFIATCSEFPYVTFKIGDFGLTQRLLELQTNSAICGTRWYMAAEVYSKVYSLPIDIYSLGATIIELAILKPLSFSIGLMQLQEGEDVVITRLRDLLQTKTEGASYSAEFIELLISCIRLNPQLRPTASVITDNVVVLMERVMEQDMDFSSTIESVSTSSSDYSEHVFSSQIVPSTCSNISNLSFVNHSTTEILSGITMYSSVQKSNPSIFQTVDRYVKKMQLGRRAWLGYDQLLERTVALKCISLGENVEYALDELVILSMIKHPNIASIEDAFFTSDQEGANCFNIVTTYYPDGSLGEQLKQRKKVEKQFTYQELLVIFYQLTLALHHVHSCGVVHRSVQLINIIVSYDGDGRILVKLLEFGSAIYLDEIDATKMFVKTRITLGKIELAPEEVNKDADRITTATDIFALGVAIFKTSCTRPFKTFSKMLPKLQKKMHFHRQYSTLPDHLYQLVYKCVHTVPEKRPTTASIKSELEQLLRQEGLDSYITSFES